MITPGFLHTSPVHVATFDALLAAREPAVRAVHVVEEGLLVQARTHAADATRAGVRAAIRELGEAGADIVCCTCSTIGEVAERAEGGVPVFRVDRPMAAESVRIGRRLAVVAALESTLEPTRALLEEEAARAGSGVEITTVVPPRAWQRFEVGDHAGYLGEVAVAAREAASSADVVVLAQASMADAVELLPGLAVPVLSSPALAVDRLVRCA